MALRPACGSSRVVDALFVSASRTRSDWQVAVPARSAIGVGMTLDAA